MAIVILVDNTNDLNLKILSKRLEMAFKNADINTSIKTCNEDIFESIKEKNKDYEYICCSYNNTSENFKKTLERGIAASSKPFCFFYYTSENTDISKLIINENFHQEEFNEILKELTHRKEENHSVILCNEDNYEISLSTESNMAVKNILNKKLNAEKKEAVMLNITNSNVTDNKKEIVPEHNNLSHIKEPKEDLKNNSDTNKLDLNSALKLYYEQAIDLKTLNEKFQSCLEDSLEKKLELLKILSHQQKIRSDIFTQLKENKINIDNLIQDMTENRQKYECCFSEEEKETLKNIRNSKQLNSIKISNRATEILKAVNIENFNKAIEMLYKSIPLIQELSEIVTEMSNFNKDIYEMTQKINNPIVPVINYEEELSKKCTEKEKIDKHYKHIQNEGTVIFSLKMGLQALCKKHQELKNDNDIKKEIIKQESNSLNSQNKDFLKEDHNIPTEDLHTNTIKEYSIPSIIQDVKEGDNNNLENIDCIKQKEVAPILNIGYDNICKNNENNGDNTVKENKLNSDLQETLKKNLIFTNKPNFFGKK